jgi:hypothetical protein
MDDSLIAFPHKKEYWEEFSEEAVSRERLESNGSMLFGGKT